MNNRPDANMPPRQLVDCRTESDPAKCKATDSAAPGLDSRARRVWIDTVVGPDVSAPYVGATEIGS